jgi:transposase
VLSLPGELAIYACTEPVDFRKQHDGLVALVRDRLAGDPFDGSIFVFFNRRRDRIKMTYGSLRTFPGELVALDRVG